MFLDDSDDPVRRQRGGRGPAHDRVEPWRVLRRPGRPRARSRARPPRHDGRRGAAPRAWRHRHRQLRLTGHGPDHGNPSPNDPARTCHASVAGYAGRRGPSGIASRSGRPLRLDGSRASVPGQGHDRAGHRPRDLGACRLPGARPSRRYRALEAGLVRRQTRARAEGRIRCLGAARRWQRIRRARRADPLPAGLGRLRTGRGERVRDVRVGIGRRGIERRWHGSSQAAGWWCRYTELAD